MHLQEIKRDNEMKGTRSCKTVLFRKFLQCGVKTWQKVIEALEGSGYDDIADEVKTRLLKDFAGHD